MPTHGILEVLDDLVFDTLHTLAPRVGTRDREYMFVIPYGAIIQTNDGPRTKEYAETSLCTAGCLPAPQKFAIRAIRCAFIGRKIVPVSSRFYADTFLRLMINMRTYWTGPAWKCADPVTMVLNADALLAIGRHARVDLVRSLRRTLKPQIVINTLEPFCLEVTFGKSWREYSDDAPDRFVVLLEGTVGRPVQ
jgi:hypothetical protein